MLKDITLGQYFPGDTVAHRLDARTKILLVLLYIVGLFQAEGWLGYITVAAVTAGCMALSHIKPANIFKEAVELAVFKSDLKTVKQLSELYKTTGFADPEYARYLNEVTSMCVASRGQLTDEEANDAVATALLVLVRELADKSLD